MRQPKTFLLLGVVLGILMLSVAYAAMQNITLEINGIATASPDQANFDVRLTNWGDEEYDQSKGNAAIECDITSDTSATFKVTGLKQVGDYVIKHIYVRNYSTDLNAYILHEVKYSNTEYFNVTVSKVNWNQYANFNQEDITLEPGNSGAFAIKVELIKLPISSEVSTSINLDIIASPTYNS